MPAATAKICLRRNGFVHPEAMLTLSAVSRPATGVEPNDLT
jgi:hypothetical protein